MIIYSIYRFVNQINGKCYVGFTQDIKKRYDNHKAYSKIKDTPFYKAIRKYGWDNFDFEILYQSFDKEHCLNEMESFFIRENNSYGHTGYNLTFGGEGGSRPMSEYVKKKVSKRMKGKISVKDVHGNFYQVSRDDPRYLSGELVGVNKGIKPSKETLTKLSEARKGNKNRLGIKHSEEMKKIISERTSKALKGKKKKVVCCPHCGKSGGEGNMKRYHFNNCKKLN